MNPSLGNKRDPKIALDDAPVLPGEGQGLPVFAGNDGAWDEGVAMSDPVARSGSGDAYRGGADLRVELDDELAAFIASVDQNNSYETEEILKATPYEQTQRVILPLPDGTIAGPFIRKYIQMNSGWDRFIR